MCTSVSCPLQAFRPGARKEMKMKKSDVKKELLLKEIKEYHAYHGDRMVEFVRLLRTKCPIDVLFLVRVVDADGKKLSMVHSLNTKANGDYYVTELGYDSQELEEMLVRKFEEEGEDDD